VEHNMVDSTTVSEEFTNYLQDILRKKAVDAIRNWSACIRAHGLTYHKTSVTIL